jgi:hypothetical protein
MAADMTPEDQAELEQITDEIMTVVTAAAPGMWFDTARAGVLEILTRRVSEAGEAYERQLKADRTHVTRTLPAHDNSTCSRSYCGHYAGQLDRP